MREADQLRVLCAAAVALVAGGAAALVISDPKPAAAPLHPPVAAAAQVVVPSGCATAASAIEQDYATWQQAQTRAARRRFIATLSPDVRLQLEAYIQAQHGGGCAAPPSSAPVIVAGTSGQTGVGIGTSSYVS